MLSHDLDGIFTLQGYISIPADFANFSAEKIIVLGFKTLRKRLVYYYVRSFIHRKTYCGNREEISTTKFVHTAPRKSQSENAIIELPDYQYELSILSDPGNWPCLREK